MGHGSQPRTPVVGFTEVHNVASPAVMKHLGTQPAVLSARRASWQGPHRFYELTGPARNKVVRLTPELSGLAESEQAPLLRHEVTARWNIVETSFASGIGRSLVGDGVIVDLATMTITDRLRRKSITGVTDAVVGFQHGRCLICNDVLVPGEPIAVDHVFPFALMHRLGVTGWTGPDLDSYRNRCRARDLQRGQGGGPAHARPTEAPGRTQPRDHGFPPPATPDAGVHFERWRASGRLAGIRDSRRRPRTRRIHGVTGCRGLGLTDLPCHCVQADKPVLREDDVTWTRAKSAALGTGLRGPGRLVLSRRARARSYAAPDRPGIHTRSA